MHIYNKEGKVAEYFARANSMTRARKTSLNIAFIVFKKNMHGIGIFA